jgi:hypothetical protein
MSFLSSTVDIVVSDSDSDGDDNDDDDDDNGSVEKNIRRRGASKYIGILLLRVKVTLLLFFAVTAIVVQPLKTSLIVSPIIPIMAVPNKKDIPLIISCFHLKKRG